MNPTIGSPLVGMKFAEIQKRYTSDDLAQDLSGGFRDILAGVGGNYLLTVDSVNGFITLADKNVVYGTDGDGISAGAMASGKNAPAIALTAAGIAMGYNRPSDGHWVNAVTIEADGNAAFSGTIRASEIIAGTVIAGGVTIAGASGDKTLDQIIAGTGYTAEQLQTDLAAGVGNIVAGVGGNYRLNIDAANGLISIGHSAAVYNGAAASGGGVRPMLGITAAGLAMGYNDNSGAWHNSIAIDASGNASFSGAINATSGNFTGTLNVGSVIAGGVTVNGTTMLTIQNGAAAGATAVQPAAITNLINRTANTVLSGTISPTSGVANSGAFKVGTIMWDTSGNLTSGSGIAITAAGIIGAKSGIPTFSIDINGNAYFKGDITGATGTFAGKIETAASITADGAGVVGAFGTAAAIKGRASGMGANALNGVFTGGGGAGVRGEASNILANGVVGINTAGVGGFFQGPTTAIDCYGGLQVRSGVSTSISIREASGVARITDSTTTDGYWIVVDGQTPLVTPGGTGCTLIGKAGANNAQGGWIKVRINGQLGYIPFWT